MDSVVATFLNRYLGGECIAVWRELAALREQTRHRRYREDAMAVARETMRRARHNVELLIQRLDAMGYRFMTMAAHDRCTKDAARRVFAIVAEISAKMDPGDKRRLDHLLIRRLPEYKRLLTERAEEARQATIDFLDATLGAVKPPLNDPAVFLPPSRQTSKDLDRLEKAAGGPLPMSLRAWYEEVGSVSLLGWDSSLSPNPGELHAGVCPDPLMIEPLRSVTRQFGEEEFEGNGYVYLAPDDVTKAGAGGCGPYSMRVPNRCADGIFAVAGLRKGPSFINYLRNTFRWGGFPGWEGTKVCPKKTIAQLANGLLPI
jgi:hypothetical protein